MVDPAYIPSPIYHTAFQNTMKKAMTFIDRQLLEWTTPVKTNTMNHDNSIRVSSYSSTTTPSLVSDIMVTTTSRINDDDNSSTCSSIQTPCTILSTSPPPPYPKPTIILSSPSTITASSSSPVTTIASSSSLSASSSTTPYPNITTISTSTAPRSRRMESKPRPLSMPIMPPVPRTPPPLYNDKKEDDDPYTHAIQKWQHRRSCMILPREEEGREDLPPYHCSVYKMGKVNVKIEWLATGKKSNRRPWRRFYIELWGTVLRIYPLSWFWSTIGKEPIYTISLGGAEATRAIEYLKRPFVVRLTGCNGMQLLIQLSNHVDMISWIEHLQAGINISLDLEERPMPKFLTLQPRRGPDTGVLCARMIEVERRREQRRRNQQETLI